MHIRTRGGALARLAIALVCLAPATALAQFVYPTKSTSSLSSSVSLQGTAPTLGTATSGVTLTVCPNCNLTLGWLSSSAATVVQSGTSVYLKSGAASGSSSVAARIDTKTAWTAGHLFEIATGGGTAVLYADNYGNVNDTGGGFTVGFLDSDFIDARASGNLQIGTAHGFATSQITVGGSNIGASGITLNSGSGSLLINHSGSQPTCSSSQRAGLWIIQGGAGVTDTVQACLKSAAGAYAWVTLVTGG